MMKISVWLGMGTLAIAGLMLTGCSSSEGSPNQVGSNDGTNTGNGSCLPPWCAYPHVLTGEDGSTYAGVFVIASVPVPTLHFTGHGITDEAGACSLVLTSDQQLTVPLLERFATLDDNGRLRVHWSETMSDSIVDAADLTLTNDGDLSGTVTAPMIVDPQATQYAVQGNVSLRGKVSVNCAAGESDFAIPLADGTAFMLNCVKQADPPGFIPCNDTYHP